MEGKDILSDDGYSDLKNKVRHHHFTDARQYRTIPYNHHQIQNGCLHR